MMLPDPLPELRRVIHSAWGLSVLQFLSSGLRYSHDDDYPEEVDTFPAVCRMGLARLTVSHSGPFIGTTRGLSSAHFPMRREPHRIKDILRC